jgi:chemotaxis protein MotB
MNNGRLKKKEEEETEDDAKWLCTFNDLMTLLLTFFVLLFSMSSLDFSSMKRFQTSLQSALGVLQAGDMTAVAIIQSKLDSNDDYEIATEEVVDEESEKIDQALEALDSEPGIRVTYTKEGVVLTLENTVLFASGSADINAEAFPLLQKITGWIRKVPLPVRIEGHTDNVPICTEQYPSNWELSTARAVNVVKHFVTVGEIPPQRLSAVGYGQSRPKYPNDTPEDRIRNRRVEIILVKEGKE